MVRSLTICALYAGTSIAISMIYKAVLSVYAFDAKFLLLAMQLGMSVAFCSFAKARLQHIPGLELPDFNWDLARASVPMGLLFFANVAVGWYGLQLVNVPMFLCVRRTATAFTLAAEWYVLRKSASPVVRGAVGLIVAGAVVAGWESLSRDWLGYVYTLGNNAFTALSLTHTKKFSDRTGVRGFGVVMYNAYVALPVTLFFAVASGELSYLASYPRLWEPGFLLSVLVASSLGVFMSYIVFLCTTVNSPLATSITGNMKDVVSTVLGMALFSGFVPTAYTGAGLAISFTGSGVFSYAKLVEASQTRPASAAATGGVGAAGPGMSGKVTPTVASSAGHFDGASDGSGSARDGASDMEAGDTARNGWSAAAGQPHFRGNSGSIDSGTGGVVAGVSVPRVTR
jgi:solute carrier family 35 protein